MGKSDVFRETLASLSVVSWSKLGYTRRCPLTSLWK